MKKTFLSLGSAAAILTPIVGVVACSETKKEEEKSISEKIKEAFSSKIVLLNSVGASATGQTQANAIISWLEKEHALVLLKGHTLMVKAATDAEDSSTLAVITGTTEATATKVFVTVKAGETKVVDSFEIKVRKKTDKENHDEQLMMAKKLVEMHSTSATKLIIDISNINAISGVADAGTSNAWTDQELSVGIALALNAKPGTDRVATPTQTGSINIVVKEIQGSSGDTLEAIATSNGENTFDLSSPKRVKIELTFGTGADLSKEDVVLFVEAQA